MWIWAALGALTLSGMDAIYWLLFSVWMTAYPFAANGIWKQRFYFWLAAAVLIALLCSFLFWRLYRATRKPKQNLIPESDS